MPNPPMVSVAVLLGLVGGASLLVNALVALLYVPGVFAVTATLTVQLAPAARLPPVKPIEVEFSVAPVIDPPQVLASAGVEWTRRPLGKASLNARPLRLVERGFAMVIVKVEGAPAVIPVTEKLLAMVGKGCTVRVALAALPLPAFVVTTAPVLLLYALALALVTSIETVQLPPAAMVPLVSATEPPPGLAITVPAVQDVVAFIVAAFTKPAG